MLLYVHTPCRTQNWQSTSPSFLPPVRPPVCPSAEERHQLFWVGASVSQVPFHIFRWTCLVSVLWREAYIILKERSGTESNNHKNSADYISIRTTAEAFSWKHIKNNEGSELGSVLFSNHRVFLLLVMKRFAIACTDIYLIICNLNSLSPLLMNATNEKNMEHFKMRLNKSWR